MTKASPSPSVNGKANNPKPVTTDTPNPEKITKNGLIGKKRVSNVVNSERSEANKF